MPETDYIKKLPHDKSVLPRKCVGTDEVRGHRALGIRQRSLISPYQMLSSSYLDPFLSFFLPSFLSFLGGGGGKGSLFPRQDFSV